MCCAPAAKGLGAATFLLDMLKGCAAVWLGALLAALLLPDCPAAQRGGSGRSLRRSGPHVSRSGCAFSGGKGVATGFGVFLVAAPLAALAAIAVFALVLAAQPLCFAGFHPGRGAAFRSSPGSSSGASARHSSSPCRHAVALLIIAKHHQNIRRLLAGTETRFGSCAREKTRMSRIVVLGSGAWGTAIALSLHRRGGHHITLWAHSAERPARSTPPAKTSSSSPAFPLPAEIDRHRRRTPPLRDADIVVSVIPSEFLRPTLARLGTHLHNGQFIVSATKGVEDRTLSAHDPGHLADPRAGRASCSPSAHFQVPASPLKWPRASPPPSRWPSAIPQIAALIQQEFSSETLRLYTSTDVIGVELGGALKNVIAIAAGIAAGVGLGYNSAAALMTRGIAEITRLAVACGGRRETLAGLSGVGDLVLTCTGR